MNDPKLAELLRQRNQQDEAKRRQRMIDEAFKAAMSRISKQWKQRVN